MACGRRSTARCCASSGRQSTPRTKTRLLCVICEGTRVDSLWQMLEQRSLFGEVTSPQTALTAYRIPVPANCPEWALELLPPRSVVRWMMEDVDRALRLAENYWSLGRFDANIAVPLAALTAALPSSP